MGVVMNYDYTITIAKDRKTACGTSPTCYSASMVAKIDTSGNIVWAKGLL
jgi:hypothetical protein